MPKQWWENDALAPTEPAEGDWWKRDALDPDFVKGPQASATHPGFLESIGAKFKAGYERGKSLTTEAIGDVLPDLRSDETKGQMDTVAQGLGFKDDAQMGTVQKANRIASDERRAQGMDKETDAMARGNQEIANAQGFGDSAKAIFSNPQAVAGTVAESVGMMAPGMAAAMAGGPVGAVAVGSQSYAIEHESTIRDTMQQAGVDITDPMQVSQALQNPELMAEARRRGTARAIPVATFDALTAGFAGRLLAGARGAGSAVVRTGGELGMQAGGGMAGETAGQLAADDKITSPSDIIMEGVAELPTEITEAPANVRRGREAAERNRTKEQVQADYRDLAEAHGTVITSMERPIINRGARERSQHPKGTAADFRTRNWSEEQAQAFMADARARGYEVVDERHTDQPHIHVELPPGGHVTNTGHSSNVPASSPNVAESPGAAAFQEKLDAARRERGLDSGQAESQIGTSPEPTKTAAPPAALPGMDVQDLLEQHRSALADANDKTRTAEERRASKRRAQYLMAEVEAQNAKPASAQIEAVKNTMLDQAAAGSGIQTPAGPATAAPLNPQVATPELKPQVEAPAVAAQAAPQQAPVSQPADVQPMAPAPAVAAQAQPAAPAEQPLPQQQAGSVWQTVAEARTQGSEAVRYMLNKDPGLLSVALTPEHSKTVAQPRQLAENEVVETRLAPEQEQHLSRIGKLLGRRIIPYSLKTPGANNIVGLAFDNKHIFINVGAARAENMSLVGLVGHEFTHTLRAQGNASLESLINFAKTRINGDNNYVKQQWAAYSNGYASRGYSPEQMGDVFTEELVADLIGDIIMDENFWADLAAHDEGLFRRTLKSLISFLRGLADKAQRLGDDEAFHEIDKLRARAVMMLQTYIKDNARAEQKAAIQSSPNVVQLQPKAKLAGETPEQERARIARETRIAAGTQRAAAHFEKREYMPAAREAAAVSDTYAPPMEIDTPEKRKFFEGAHPTAAVGNLAPVHFHGTARDVTTFRPKQGDAVFLAPEQEFTAPYQAAGQHWVNAHGQDDIEVDGQSMKELREQSKPGSVEYVVADLLMSAKGDIAQAKELLDNYSYVSGTEMDNDFAISGLDSDERDAVMEKLDQIEFLENENPGFIQKGGNGIKSGMNVMPLVTNVKKPFDFENKQHVKKLMADLRETFRFPREFGRALTHPQKFDSWDEVQHEIERGAWTIIEDRGGGIPQTLKDMGFDAYHVHEEGFKNLAVFDPRQIKSAYGNVGSFGVREPTAEEAASLGMTLEEAIAAQKGGDIRLRLGNILSRTFTNGLYNDGTRAQLERWFLDEYRDVREIQKVIGAQTFGGRVPANMDVHRNENLRHGAYQDARNRAEERFIKPIARALSKAGVSLEDFSRYLWWRHAGERDAYLRNKMDPALAANTAPDALAGIDPRDAAANIAALDPRTRRAFERAAKFIDGMRHFTLDTLLRSGQITQDYYDAVLRQYQHYVPLRGMPDGSEALNGGGKSGKGLSMNDKGLGPRAKGRKSEPQNIIEEMMRDMDSALVGTQKQRVLESLVRLIAAHPDPDLWEVQPVAAERKWVNGVLTVVQTNGEAKNQITFMHRGIPVKIEIRHEGMRKAMLNLNEPLPKLLRTVGRITRFLSAVKTSFSPFFLLVNPVRDAGLAMMGMGAEHGMGAIRDMAKFYPHTYEVLAKDQARKIAPITSGYQAATRNQLQQYAREFAAIGGKTGYTYVADIREQQHKLQHLMDRHAKSKGMKDIMAGNFDSKDAGLLMRKSFQHVAHLFETLNDLSENSTRLAVYAAMREKGLSVEDAAAYAKEVTVNFNRRGSASKILNGFYMFFNAAMQGSARLARLMKNRKFQGMMGSLFAASYAAALGQMFAAGDDDDGESKYGKAISDGQAQRSISIYLGNGKSFAIPVPYGPNIFSYMGYRMAKLHYDLAKGKNPSIGKATGDIVSQAMTSMSPIDPGKGLQAFLPEFVRIFANAQQNRNDFGGKITYKVDPFDETGNPLHYKTDVKTGTPYRWLAQALNNATGGDGYKGGAINWTGEQTRYAVEQLTGGMGRLANESWELAENMLAGIDPEPSDIPLLNVYLRGHGADQVNGSYFDNLDDYEDTVADWKLAVANDDQAKIEEILKRAPWVDGAEADASTKEGRDIQSGSVMEDKRRIDRQMKSLKQQRDAIMADDSLSWQERKRQTREIELELDELKKDFNYSLNSGRGYPELQGTQ